MNTTASVERRIAAMLADEGLVRAPESALADVLTVVDGTTQRRRTWPSPVIAVPRMDSRQRLIVALAAALLIAGIVVAGALLARPPDPSPCASCAPSTDPPRSSAMTRKPGSAAWT